MERAPLDEELELRDYAATLWRRKVPIVVTVVLLTAAALALSYSKTPVYEATAEVLLQPRSTESLFGAESGRIPQAAKTGVQTEIRLLQSKPVRDAVSKQLGGAPPASGRQAGDTDVMEVSARSTEPERAAAVADAYARAYIDFRRTQAVEDILAAGTQVQEKISELQPKVDAAEGLQKQKLLDQQSLFKQKLDELQVDGALKTGGAQLVTPASPPTLPVSPKPVRAGVTAFAVALILGMGLAFLLEHLDDSVKTNDDIEEVPGGPPVIGLIPAVSGWSARDDPLVVSVTEPKSSSAEAYRTLRTAVQFLGLEHPMKTLQLTSANAGEGKTTTLANLGVAMSAAGLRVVMVCCDLRRPRIHEFFGLGNEVGITSVLLGTDSLSNALQQVPGNDRLFLLASGPLPPNPSELLSSGRTAEVLTALEAGADIVLVDSPPVLPVTDALVLSGRVDATVMVAVAGATTRKEVARTIELLRRVDAPLIGAVLNGVDASGGYGGYGYQYARYEKAATPRKPARLRRNAPKPEAPKPAAKAAKPDRAGKPTKAPATAGKPLAKSERSTT